MVIIVAVVYSMMILGPANVMIIAKRHVVSMRVGAETLIANRVRTPICMTVFPVVEPRQTRPIQGQPCVARTEIIILRTDDSDIFRSVRSKTSAQT